MKSEKSYKNYTFQQLTMTISLVNHVSELIESIWNNQSKPRKNIAVIVVLIPSFMILREIYWFIYRKYHSLPPGPNGLPLIGFMGTWSSSTTARIGLGKKYGAIMYATGVGMPMIILSSSKLMKVSDRLRSQMGRGVSYRYFV